MQKLRIVAIDGSWVKSGREGERKRSSEASVKGWDAWIFPDHRVNLDQTWVITAVDCPK
ncbi:MAG: hypothetical protein IMZ62_15650 [Chloroflexi bacterium]|nr:hypothetical protein [Chloroflexota bacterium]